MTRLGDNLLSLRRTRREAISVAAGTTVLGLASCTPTSERKSTRQTPDGKLAGDVLFWHSFTQGPRADYMERMARQFEAQNPDVRIRIESFAWPEFYTKWTTGLTAGEVPDLSTALPNHVVQMIDAQALVPIDGVVDKIGRDRFTDAALREGQVGETNYSIPIYTHAQVMWYRQDLLDQAGLTVPQTWSELKQAAIELTSGDVYGMSVPFGSNDMLGARYLNFYVQSAGTNLLTEDGKANLTSDAAIDGIRYWVDAYRKTSPTGSINYNILDQSTLFYQGRTAFDFNSGFHISGVEGSSPDLLDSIAAAPLPRIDHTDPVYGGETSNIPMVVWGQSAVQEEAKAFMQFLFNDSDYIKFLHSVPGGMLPSLSDLTNDPTYQDNAVLTRFADSVDVIEEAVPMGSAIGMEDGPAPQSGILTSQGVIERMFHDIILNDTPPPEAAEAAENELNELFEFAQAGR